jgi:hypothetical protein
VVATKQGLKRRLGHPVSYRHSVRRRTGLTKGSVEGGGGQRTQLLSAPLPSIKPSVQGISDAFASWLKRTGSEAARSPSYNDQLDNEWSYTSITHVFMTQCYLHPY